MQPTPNTPDEDTDENPEGLEPEGLDEFLRNMFGTTQATDGRSIPSLDKLRETFRTKSAIIRELHSTYGLPTKEISKYTGIRYQMVNNVLTNKLKRGPNEFYNRKVKAFGTAVANIAISHQPLDADDEQE